MSFPYQQDGGQNDNGVLKDFTIRQPSQAEKSASYKPDEGLVAAVNVALMLGQPLLVTGEPGTGKTQLAYSVNWQLRFKNPQPFVFNTKSTSGARDLFYTYDAIARFYHAQTIQIQHARQQQKLQQQEDLNQQGLQPQEVLNQEAMLLEDPSQDDPAAYITYNALGAAILHANSWDKASRFFSANKIKQMTGEEIENWQSRSVVLIDEIDKAPRDFPNDILNEIENMSFRVSELGDREIRVENDGFRPVVILTSNSEKSLPDAFLRRCVYYHIAFPEPEQMRSLVVARLFPELKPAQSPATKEPRQSADWLDNALELFYEIRDSEPSKKPATAELLGWLTAIRNLNLQKKFEDLNQLSAEERKLYAHLTLNVLTKSETDRETVQEIVHERLNLE